MTSTVVIVLVLAVIVVVWSTVLVVASVAIVVRHPLSMVGPSLSSLITVVVMSTALVVVMAVGKACSEVLENIDS